MKNLFNQLFGPNLCPRENILQPFPFKTDGGFEKKKILEDGSRAPLTMERKNQLCVMLSEVERLFDCTGLSWSIDGGLSVSLLKGEFIGEHRDLDIAVESRQLRQLQEMIEGKRFGLFVTLNVEKRETMVMKRVDWKNFSRANTYLFWIIAVDENGLIQKDKPLSFINVHIIRRNKQGIPLSEGKRELPVHWFYPRAVEFQGSFLNVAAPIKTVYFKLQSLRNYDLTDIRHLFEAGSISLSDIEEIESILNAEGESQYEPAYYRARKNFVAKMKTWFSQ